MDLNFKDFIDSEQHEKSVKEGFCFERNNCTDRSRNYFLYKAKEFCFKDIEKVAETIYNKIMRKKNSGQLKIKAPSFLNCCIKEGTISFLDMYCKEIFDNGVGVAPKSIGTKVNDLKEVFEGECRKQAEIFEEKYRDYCRKKRSDQWTLWFAGIAAFTSFFTGGLPYFTMLWLKILQILQHFPKKLS